MKIDERKLEDLIENATNTIQASFGVFKDAGSELVEKGDLTQLEYNKVKANLDKMLAMSMDPNRQTEALAFEKKINKDLEELIKNKTEKEQ